MSARIAGAETDIDARVARAIRAQRGAIAATLFEKAIRSGEVTVGIELLAHTLVERFADALESAIWPGFFTWIDLTCDKHSGAAPIMRLLTLGSSTMLASVGETLSSDVAMRSNAVALGEEIGRIVARPRRTKSVLPNDSLEEIDVAIDRLISRLNAFDAATADHSRAVSMWCARIGKQLALSAKETAFLMRAGLIHDIGKVTTPAHILNAPHRLSDPDMAIMREHAGAGADIVSKIPLLAHLTPAVRGHHERVDGRGYPDGLEGAEIPLTVRIVSVADSFNAMIGNRPYRLPMSPTAALEQLKRHRGSQFDSNVVIAMIDVVHPPR